MLFNIFQTVDHTAGEVSVTYVVTVRVKALCLFVGCLETNESAKKQIESVSCGCLRKLKFSQVLVSTVCLASDLWKLEKLQLDSNMEPES